MVLWFVNILPGVRFSRSRHMYIKLRGTGETEKTKRNRDNNLMRMEGMNKGDGVLEKLR